MVELDARRTLSGSSHAEMRSASAGTSISFSSSSVLVHANAATAHGRESGAASVREKQIRDGDRKSVVEGKRVLGV